IQIAIIAVALICGYKAIESLVGALITILYELSYNAFSQSVIIQYILLTAFYFGIFFLSVRYNRQIADYIDKQGQATAGTGSETVNLLVEQRGLLFIVIVGLCLATLITEIPTIVLSIYNYFKKEVGGNPFGSAADIDFKNAAVKFVFTLIILFYAKLISAWLSRQISPHKAVIETKSES
ncbi:MAG TPA: hypothetical protein VI461_17280, partial [Chitinophagaceae bacterium]|nr:hypothetical protein [Chitinophagaceae bacterium]